MLGNLKYDLSRCGDSRGKRIRELVFNTGMWAVVGYRFNRWAISRPRHSWIQRPLNFLTSLVGLWVEVTTNISLPLTAEIGPGLYIAHTGYIVVSSGTVIGRNCTLTQGVTIGHAGGGSKSAAVAPVLGDRVYVGPGSAIIGPITIGDDALIGVGAIVVKSVPARGVVVGNPGRVRSLSGSFDLIQYPGQETDPARAASLALRDLESSAADKPATSSSDELTETSRTAPDQHDI